MSDTENTKENIEQPTTDAPVEATKAAPQETRGRGDAPRKREFKKNRRQTRRPRERSEFDQRILSIRRVTRVSSGGRRFSFSVVIAIGDGKGKIGVGVGKATDTALAIEKAVKDAKKNLITINHTNTMSIPHEVSAKYTSALVYLQPSPGRGVVAGSAVRDLVELAGIKDIVGKIMSGSKNKLNIARATIAAFDSLNTPKSHHAPAPKKEKKERVVAK